MKVLRSFSFLSLVPSVNYPLVSSIVGWTSMLCHNLKFLEEFSKVRIAFANFNDAFTFM